MNHFLIFIIFLPSHLSLFDSMQERYDKVKDAASKAIVCQVKRKSLE